MAKRKTLAIPVWVLLICLTVGKEGMVVIPRLPVTMIRVEVSRDRAHSNNGVKKNGPPVARPREAKNKRRNGRNRQEERKPRAGGCRAGPRLLPLLFDWFYESSGQGAALAFGRRAL